MQCLQDIVAEIKSGITGYILHILEKSNTKRALEQPSQLEWKRKGEISQINAVEKRAV